jgi:sporulation protein YlmC with PRC-barrel domain
MGIILATSMKNLAVYSKDMINVGKIKDLEFDTTNMIVTSIIVEFEKDAAKEVLGKKLVIRRAKGKVPPESIERIGEDAMNLKLPLKELKGAFKGA